MLRCAITDGSADSRSDWLVARCAALADDGVDFVIVRERELDPAALTAFARRVVQAAAGARVLVASEPRRALDAGAAGVHLSSRPDELTPAEVRALIPEAYVTQSCHTLGDVRRARDQGANAVLFGPVFGKWVGGVEVVPGVGLERLAEAVDEAGRMLVLALGGITRENELLCAGAGVAGIRRFFT